MCERAQQGPGAGAGGIALECAHGRQCVPPPVSCAYPCHSSHLRRPAFCSIFPSLIRHSELDVTFSGGGFKNAYCLGVGLALEVLQTQWQRGYVRRWSGASAGVSITANCIDSVRLAFWRCWLPQEPRTHNVLFRCCVVLAVFGGERAVDDGARRVPLAAQLGAGVELCSPRDACRVQVRPPLRHVGSFLVRCLAAVSVIASTHMCADPSLIHV